MDSSGEIRPDHAQAYEGWEDEDIQDGPPNTMALSIIRDLEALAGMS
jgi:hypothetical protein